VRPDALTSALSHGEREKSVPPFNGGVRRSLWVRENAEQYPHPVGEGED